MIYPAVKFLSETLNQFLVNTFQLNENIVSIDHLSLPDGAASRAIDNKVVLTVINIEEETLKPFYSNTKRLPSGEFAQINEMRKYKLFVLFSCNHRVYSEALKFIDAILLFFQQTPFVSSETNSDIPEPIQKLDFEIEKINYTAMQNLWNSMGVKYRPSLVYMIRLIGVQSGVDRAFLKPIMEGVTNIKEATRL